MEGFPYEITFDLKHFYFVVLLSNNGELLRKFKRDPVKYLRFVVGADNINDEIVHQISDRFFSLDKPFDPNQIPKLIEVIEETIHSFFYPFYQDIKFHLIVFIRYFLTMHSFKM